MQGAFHQHSIATLLLHGGYAIACFNRRDLRGHGLLVLLCAFIVLSSRKVATSSRRCQVVSKG